MIEDTKFVKTIEAKKGAKGTFYKVTWVDDKFFNVFDSQIVKVCQRGLKENLAVNYTTEKDAAGWYRLLTAEVVTADMLPEEVEPVTPPPQIDEPTKEELGAVIEQDKRVVDAISHPIDARQHDIHKQVALYCVVRLTCHGLMELSKLKQNTEMLLQYLDGE